MIVDFLPVGSIVKLKNQDELIMIITRTGIVEGKVIDYIGVLYPYGYIPSANAIYFNESDIEEIIFEGYINEYEVTYAKELKEEYNNYLKSINK